MRVELKRVDEFCHSQWIVCLHRLLMHLCFDLLFINAWPETAQNLHIAKALFYFCQPVYAVLPISVLNFQQVFLLLLLVSIHFSQW